MAYSLALIYYFSELTKKYIIILSVILPEPKTEVCVSELISICVIEVCYKDEDIEA